MKNLLLILIFLCPIIVCSQIAYSFDMVLTYDFLEHKKGKKKHEVVYLVNSNDNSYFARLTEKSKNTITLELTHSDHLYTRSKINISDFTKGSIVRRPSILKSL